VVLYTPSQKKYNSVSDSDDFETAKVEKEKKERYYKEKKEKK
jgi:hypothetical protein